MSISMTNLGEANYSVQNAALISNDLLILWRLKNTHPPMLKPLLLLNPASEAEEALLLNPPVLGRCGGGGPTLVNADLECPMSEEEKELVFCREGGHVFWGWGWGRNAWLGSGWLVCCCWGCCWNCCCRCCWGWNAFCICWWWGCWKECPCCCRGRRAGWLWWWTRRWGGCCCCVIIGGDCSFEASSLLYSIL